MNKLIIELALSSGMLNYVDHETPRHYFLSADADEKCLEQFVELILTEVIATIYGSDIKDKKQEKLVNQLLYKFGMLSETKE